MGESYKKLSFTDTTGTITGMAFNTRYEKMDRNKKLKIVAKVGDVEVSEKSTYNDIILLPGMTKKLWVDATGGVYEKSQVKFYHEDQEVSEKSQTKCFEITGFQPVSSYTDMYVIDKFYEIYPDDDGCSKDFDKECSRRKNLVGMRRLWEHLDSTGSVARGEFNTSSRGFESSDGYIRAIKFGNKWALELGVLKEEKVFQHLQEGVPEINTTTQSGVRPVLKLKRV